MYPSGQNRTNETQLMLWPQPSRIHLFPGRSCGTTAGGDPVVDAAVHLKDAFFYDANTGALLSQGHPCRG
jgi:hypothetical protein